MALLDRGRAPTPGELRYFGLILAGFGAVLAAIVYVTSDSLVATHVIWVIGILLGVIYYSVPPLRHSLYQGWMSLVYPIGWVISHVLIGVVFYLLLTPTGLLMRTFGRDPLGRKLGSRSSFWVPLETYADPRRYFQQF